MILWGVVLGALLGWVAAGFDGDAVWPGGFVGAGMGWWLRAILRREIARMQGPLHEETMRLVAAARAVDDGAPPTDEAVPRVRPPVAAPVEPFASPWAGTAPPPADGPRDGDGRGDPRVDNLLSEAAEAPVAPPLPPRGPGIAERGFAAARGWLFGGNTIVRVGLVILFVGLSFLARYAAAAGFFPIELRLAAVAAVGAALLFVGFTRRVAKPDFALSLQGGGVAVLYLTLFAASRLFEVIPAGLAFPLMIVVCALGCALALLQDSQALAATSFAGGFAVPLLLGGGGGPLGLFLYYTVLNVAVPAIAYRRSWRTISLMGFLVTFGIATAWGALAYRPEDYAIAQPFLILFVLIYVVTGILNAANRPGRYGNAVDGTLLFGPALAGFGLQVGLVRDMPYGAAFSAIGFGALYLALAQFVVRRGRGDNRVLLDGMIAVAVGFVTLAVPLALGARWTAGVWALEGAGAFWLGMRQARWAPRSLGLALQGAAVLSFFAGLRDNVSTMPLIGPNVIGAVLLAVPALAIAWWLRQPLPAGESRIARGYAGIEQSLAQPAFLYGFALGWLACGLEIGRMLPPAAPGQPPAFAIGGQMRTLLAMFAYVAGAGVAAVAGRRLGWAVALWPARATIVVLGIALAARTAPGGFVLLTPHWLVWTAALAIHYALLRADDRAGTPATLPLRRAAHVGGVWLLTAMLADSLWLAVDRAGLWRTSWAGVVFLVGVTAALAILVSRAGRAAAAGWPLAQHRVAYLWIAAVPLATLAYGAALVTALLAAGDARPLPYVPLLNPVDLTVALAIAVLALWRRAVLVAAPDAPGAAMLARPAMPLALAALGFVAINTVWLRIAHHYLGVPWDGPPLMASFVVQTGLSILWTLLALALTLSGHRRASRPLWLAGAALLAVVVAKLLLVDLSNVDGAARIVTFIVVGLLMLVVGYFAPLPPRAAMPAETPA